MEGVAEAGADDGGRSKCAEGGRGGVVNAAPEGAVADVVHKGLLLRHCLGVRCAGVRPRSHLVQPSHLRSLEEPLLLLW